MAINRLALMWNIFSVVLTFYFIFMTWGNLLMEHLLIGGNYEGWNFNFGNTPLDWIQELLE